MYFNYNLPVNITFGRGSIREIGAVTADYGTRAMIVTGQSSAKESGLLDRVVNYLKKYGIENCVYDNVRPNPLTTNAEAAAEFAVSNKCNVVIGLGGGSVMDCAKGAAFMAVNKGSIDDYIFNAEESKKSLPVILAPTTCGTGSEGNGSALLTNPKTGNSKYLRSDAIIPKASIIDSECMATMPKIILAYAGFNALCHCMEAYISRTSRYMSDMFSKTGMELISKSLIPLYEGENSPKMWDDLSFAGVLGGMAVYTAGAALPHGMEQPLRGIKNVIQGRGLAALTPVIMEESIKYAPHKFEYMSKCLGGKNEKDFINVLNKFIERLELATNLSQWGISEGDVESLTENCFKVAYQCILHHPRKFVREDIKRLYKRAL